MVNCRNSRALNVKAEVAAEHLEEEEDAWQPKRSHKGASESKRCNAKLQKLQHCGPVAAVQVAKVHINGRIQGEQDKLVAGRKLHQVSVTRRCAEKKCSAKINLSPVTGSSTTGMRRGSGI